jgi:hypothetical protein
MGTERVQEGEDYTVLMNALRENQRLSLTPFYSFYPSGGTDVTLIGRNGLDTTLIFDIARTQGASLPAFPGRYSPLERYNLVGFDQFATGNYQFHIAYAGNTDVQYVYEGVVPPSFRGILSLSGTFPDDFGLFLIPQDGAPYIPLTKTFEVSRSGNAALQQVLAYPNPAQHTVYFTTSVSGNLQVLDLQGRVVANTLVQPNLQNAVNVQHLAKGLYIYRLQTAVGETTGKLLLQD